MKLLSKNNLVSAKYFVVIFLFFSGCISETANLRTSFLPEFQKKEIKRIGILEFKNETLDPFAGLKAANIFHKVLSSYHHYELIDLTKMSKKGVKMEFVRTPEGISGLPDSVRQVERQEFSTMMNNEADIEKMPDLDAIVTGVITRYDDKEGSNIAINKPASVAFKVSLYIVKNNETKLLWSANFAETQVALLDNLLLADRFIEAGGVWLSNEGLTELGMKRVMKAFPGLISESLK